MDDVSKKLADATSLADAYYKLDPRPSVEEYLGQHESLRDLLAPMLEDSSTASFEDYGGDLSADVDMPESVGGFRILEVLGRGGFGVVYLAEQREPIRRRVALKVLKLGMDTKETLARFGAERQALALMDHPGIAKVFESGAGEDGRPYFVMEYIKGLPIIEFCDRQAVGLKQRLEIFLDVCDAVQHAHQKGVIHRDLKPSNILVTGDFTAKIIDFGIAKAIDRDLVEETLVTRSGQRLGTLEYMSPEQAAGRATDIDTRSDIYSLGLVLYELLTGNLPWERKDYRAAAVDKRPLVSPVRPSQRLRGDRESRRWTAWKQVRGDLDWIVLRAIETVPRDRYAGVSDLADDVRRFIEMRPVSACPPSFISTVTKLIRRNRTTSALVALVVLALGLGIAGYVSKNVETRNAYEALARETEQKSQAIAYYDACLASVDPGRAGDQSVSYIDFLVAAGKRLEASTVLSDETRKRIGRTLARALFGHGARLKAAWVLSIGDPDALVLTDVAPDADRETLARQLMCATLLVARGEYEEGAHWLEQMDEIARRREDLADAFVVQIAVELMQARYDQFQQQKVDSATVRAAVDRALALARDRLGRTHRYSMRAELYRLVFEPENGVDLADLRELLERQRDMLGADDADCLRTMEAIVRELTFAQRWEEAETLHAESMEVCNRTHGPAHPDTLRMRMNFLTLASAVDAKHLPDLQEALEHGIGILESDLGPTNPLVMWYTFTLAYTYASQNDDDRALDILRKCAPVLRREHGPEYSRTHIAEFELARILVKRREVAEAAVLLRRLLDESPIEPIEIRATGFSRLVAALRNEADSGLDEEGLDEEDLDGQLRRLVGDVESRSLRAAFERWEDVATDARRLGFPGVAAEYGEHGLELAGRLYADDPGQLFSVVDRVRNDHLAAGNIERAAELAGEKKRLGRLARARR